MLWGSLSTDHFTMLADEITNCVVSVSISFYIKMRECRTMPVLFLCLFSLIFILTLILFPSSHRLYNKHVYTNVLYPAISEIKLTIAAKLLY